MSVLDDAAYLEALFPQAIGALFYSGEEDPLRHHSVGQVRLMRSLMAGSKTASELSLYLGISPSSLTQMASRMILAGLVSKELDARDRRVRKLSLTTAGRSLMEGRQAMRARAACSVLEKMGPEQIRSLISLLEEIRKRAAESSLSLVEAAV